MPGMQLTGISIIHSCQLTISNENSLFLFSQIYHLNLHFVHNSWALITAKIFTPVPYEGEHPGQTQIYYAQQEHRYPTCITQSSNGLTKPFHCKTKLNYISGR